jgi:hypothetical protein
MGFDFMLATFTPRAGRPATRRSVGHARRLGVQCHDVSTDHISLGDGVSWTDIRHGNGCQHRRTHFASKVTTAHAE